MKKIIVSICVIMVLTISIGIATTKTEGASNTVKREQRIQEEEALKKKVAEEGYKNPKSFDSNTVVSDDGSDELAAKYEAFKKQDEAKNKNDLYAYEVLKKYDKKEVNKIITDKTQDYEVMGIMCDMLKSEDLSSDESEALRQYLDRRDGWIDDDDELKTTIKTVLEQTK